MAGNLPLVQSADLSLMLLQSRWKSTLDPLLRNQLVDGVLLTDVALVTGENVINHLLGRKQVGWIIVDRDASTAVYRSAALNDLTLTLNSSGSVTVSIWCF